MEDCRTMSDQLASEKVVPVPLQSEMVAKERVGPMSQIVTALQDEAAKAGTSLEDKILLEGASATLQLDGADWEEIVSKTLARRPGTPLTEIVQDLMTPKRGGEGWPPMSEIDGYVEVPVQVVDTRDPYKFKGETQGYYPIVTEEDWKQTVLFQARQATVAENVLKQLGYLMPESSVEAIFDGPIEYLELFQREFRGHKVSGKIRDLMWEEGKPVKRTQWEVLALKSPVMPDVRAGVSFWYGSTTPGKVEVRLIFGFGPGAVAAQGIGHTAAT